MHHAEAWDHSVSSNILSFSITLCHADPVYSLSHSSSLILTHTSPCSHATCTIPHHSAFYYSSSLYQGGASPLPPLSASCYGAVVNSGLDLSVICICVCVWSCETHDLPCDISFKHVESWAQAQWIFYWSLTILIFHCIAALLIFEQSVKWQWLEQERVNRPFAYRKLLYYSVHSRKLSLWGNQNVVTSLREEEAEKWPLLTRILTHTCTEAHQPWHTNAYT